MRRNGASHLLFLSGVLMSTKNKKRMSFDRKLIILFAGMLTFVCSAAIAADTIMETFPDPIAGTDVSRSSAP